MTYRSQVAVVYLLGFFLDLINMFIASVAFPAMAHAFNTTPSALAWVSNGYIAGLTLAIPFSSLLSRRIGPKRVILLSLFLFSAASAAAGWIFFATLPVAIVTFVLACLWLKHEMPAMNAARLLNLSLLADPLLRFSMLVYICVPGVFIGVNVTGMFYLQNVANMSPAATGMLMLPWSVASFIAITATGRYFNRIGPRPLIVIGCLLQATGILLLIDVSSATLLPAVAFALMGAGGSLCSSTAQSSAFLTTRRDEMPDASALWNLNRQLSFFAGALLLAQVLNLAQAWLTPHAAWHGMFIFAAGMTLLPVPYVFRLNNTQVLNPLRQENS